MSGDVMDLGQLDREMQAVKTLMQEFERQGTSRDLAIYTVINQKKCTYGAASDFIDMGEKISGIKLGAN